MSRLNHHYSHSQEKYYEAGCEHGRCSQSGCKVHWFLECTSRRIFGCVFNPLASCNRNKQMKAVYQQHERKKQRVYNQRVREVERGTFAPLVLTATGGMGPSASIFFQKLGAMIAAKRGHTCQKVITWIRQRLTFSLLRSTISAIRATEFLPPPPPDPNISILTSGGSG